MEIKQCSKCKFEKSISEFGKSSKTKDGLRWMCKQCCMDAYYAYKEKYPEKLRERHRAYYRRNKNTVKAKNRRLYKRDKDYYREYGAQYRAENEEKEKAKAAVNVAVRKGEIPQVSHYQCAAKHCNRQAANYHHESYREEDWLKVIPLCRSCHKLIHSGLLDKQDIGMPREHVGRPFERAQ